MKQSLKTEKLFWITDPGKELLKKIYAEAAESNFDTAKTTLRVKGKKAFKGENDLSKAIEIVIARHKAENLCAWTDEALFTATSLEQATHPEVAKHHASRFKGFSHVLEIGTGAGFDTAALASVSKRVTSIEINPELLQMAEWNLSLQGIRNVELIEGDSREIIANLNLSEIDGIFCDPSRRLPNGERTKDPEKWSPNIEFLRKLDFKKLIGVKISPAVDIDDPYWSKEWIGFQGECKEQILWHSDKEISSSVSIIDKDFYINENNLPQNSANEVQEFSNDGYLLEPHSALSRSGFFPRFLRANNSYLLHSKVHIGYAPDKIDSSSVTQFKLIDSLSFHSKALSKKLLELGIGEKSVIKTRGIADSPESIAKELSFSENGKVGVLFFIRLGKEIKVFICEKER